MNRSMMLGRTFRRIWMVCGLTVIGVVGSFSTARPTETWLSGIDSVSRPKMFPGSPSDYLELFRPDAPWSGAAAHVAVFQTTGGFLLNSPEDVLRQFFSELRRRHIALAIEALILSPHDACGAGVEAYSAPASMEAIAKRVKVLGGDLRFLTMDEPLWFGRYYSGQNACHSSLQDIARDVAAKVAVLRRYFPDLKVGDTEPLAIPDPADWVDDIMQWTQAYQSAVGEPLAWIHADVGWYGRWREQLQELSRRLQATGVSFGIIYNGDSTDRTDEDWTRHAEERFAAVETDVSLIPDHAVLQTWMFHPQHMLPEAQRGTMTYLVNRYTAIATRLLMRRQGLRLTGELTDVSGRPIEGGTIQIYMVDNGARGVDVVRRLTGAVPAEAATAVLALRINTSCGCAGTASVAIGTMRYHDEPSGQEFQRRFSPPPEHTVGDRIVATPADHIGINAEPIPVTPGSGYSLEVPMRVSYDSGGSGYVAVNFLDLHGKQIHAEQILFERSERSVGDVVTDGSGRFSLNLEADPAGKMPSFFAEFAGDPGHRLSSILVP